MRTRSWLGRTIASFSVMSALALLIALPAGATPPSNGGHIVTICHVTESANNPYVLLTVDVAAFDGEGKNDHTSHQSKDGRMDVEAEDGICPPGGPTPTTVIET